MKAIILLSLLAYASSNRQEYVDPFKALDQHISQAFSQHYLWPWSQLMKAAAFLDDDSFSEPQIVSEKEKMTINMNVRRFKPEELRIRVKNRNIVVEAKQKMDNNNRFMANHFVQRFVLPPGSKQEEVAAVLKPNGVLSISVPRHEVPPPPPEIEVPIEVLKPVSTEKPMEIPEKKTDKPPKKASENVTKAPELPVKNTEEVTEKQAEVVKPLPPVTSSPTPLEHLELVEATTHNGKIRKKELKETKTVKDNEVDKGVDNNGLDYALIDSE